MLLRESGATEADPALEIRRRHKPDYYSWFPRFSIGELRSRLSWLNPIVATQLRPSNVAALAADGINVDWIERLKGGAWSEKAEAIRMVMKSMGIPSHIVSAISSVNRSQFVPVSEAKHSFFNQSFVEEKHTNCTEWGIISILLSNIGKTDPTVVGEVGSGRGYFLTILDRVYPSLEKIGWEQDENIGAQADQSGLFSNSKITYVNRAFEWQNLRILSGGLLFFSCGLTAEMEKRLIDLCGHLKITAVYSGPVDKEMFDGAVRQYIERKRGRPVEYKEYGESPSDYMVVKRILGDVKPKTETIIFNCGFVIGSMDVF